MSDRDLKEAFVTLATNDSYAVGALVLSQSLRSVGTTRQLVLMVTSQVSQPMREQLLYAFDSLVEVDILDSRDNVNLTLLARPDLGLTFTKLHCWRLTQYDKCVFMDADTLVLQNIDELFENEEIAAAPDVGWPDCFNSGVFVYRPSADTYAALLNFALAQGSFDGGDQGLLNQYFSDWSTQGKGHRLPFIYNTVAQAFYSYSPAFKQFGHNVKVIHFIGAIKPWHIGFNAATREVEGGAGNATEFVKRWWSLFYDKVHHQLPETLKTTLALPQAPWGHEGFVALPAGDAPNLHVFTKHQLDDGQRQYSWEKGQIDYMGVDSFDNILKQLDTKIGHPNGSAPYADVANQNRVKEVRAAAATTGAAAPIVFPKDSEFHKFSTDARQHAPPRSSVHRRMIKIPTRVYNEQLVKVPRTTAAVPEAKEAATIAKSQTTAAPTPTPASDKSKAPKSSKSPDAPPKDLEEESFVVIPPQGAAPPDADPWGEATAPPPSSVQFTSSVGLAAPSDAPRVPSDFSRESPDIEVLQEYPSTGLHPVCQLGTEAIGRHQEPPYPPGGVPSGAGPADTSASDARYDLPSSKAKEGVTAPESGFESAPFEIQQSYSSTTSSQPPSHDPFAAQDPLASQGLYSAQAPYSTQDPLVSQHGFYVQDPLASQQPYYAQDPLASQQGFYGQDPLATQQPFYAQDPYYGQDPLAAQQPFSTQDPSFASYQSYETTASKTSLSGSIQAEDPFAATTGTSFTASSTGGFTADPFGAADPSAGVKGAASFDVSSSGFAVDPFGAADPAAVPKGTSFEATVGAKGKASPPREAAPVPPASQAAAPPKSSSTAKKSGKGKGKK